MLELKLGKMTYRELGAWFGYKDPDNFSRTKAKTKKMELLKKFADYHYEGKSVIIDKIHIPVFTKAYEVIEREFDNEWGHIIDKDRQLISTLKEQKIDTCARVGKIIWYKNPEVQGAVSQITAQAYTGKVKRERYGRNYIKGERGTHGYSEYVWMNKDETGPLDGEHLEIFKECMQTAFQEVDLIRRAIEDDYIQGNINKEEYSKALGDVEIDESYAYFMQLTIEKLGYFPTKRTRLVDEIIFKN